MDHSYRSQIHLEAKPKIAGIMSDLGGINCSIQFLLVVQAIITRKFGALGHVGASPPC